MALSQYLARDKSTIDQMIPSRPAGSITSADYLLIYDTSVEEAKKVTVADAVSASPTAEFEAGVEMVFMQANVPTGWTLETSPTYNEGFIRASIGNAALSTGGSTPFTTVFADTTTAGNVSLAPKTAFSSGGHAVTTANMPPHTHGTAVRLQANQPAPDRSGAAAGRSVTTNAPSSGQVLDVIDNTPVSHGNTSSHGTGNPHVHTISSHNHTTNLTGDAIGDMELKYSDSIICSKD